ncbi:MAG: cytochrome P460 family protein, partial [Pseudomonadales bacterium]
MKKLFTTSVDIVTIVTALLLGVANAQDYPKPTFDEDGKLNRPDISYREWIFVGTPLTPNELNPPEAPVPEFHNVYIHLDDFEHWKRTGTFQEGTVLIKELVSVGSKQAVSGNGYFMGEFAGLEATIKDSKRFKDEPGYWAYFTFGHSYPLADKSEAFPAAACNACHEASAADDFVFTQYYPVLRAAKGPAKARSGRVMDTADGDFKKISAAMSGAMGEAMKPTASTGSVLSVVPTDDKKLHEWLRKGDYKKWADQETENHPSAGPHTKYGLPGRVYLEPKIATSM